MHAYVCIYVYTDIYIYIYTHVNAYAYLLMYLIVTIAHPLRLLLVSFSSSSSCSTLVCSFLDRSARTGLEVKALDDTVAAAQFSNPTIICNAISLNHNRDIHTGEVSAQLPVTRIISTLSAWLLGLAVVRTLFQGRAARHWCPRS